MLEVACELLNIDLKWQEDKINDTGLFDMKVIGPSPSDESVIIIDLKVAVDDIVEAGDVLAEIEATKSTGEIISPVKGKIKSIFVKNDESIFVGENLLQIEEINDGKASSQNLNSIQSNCNSLRNLHNHFQKARFLWLNCRATSLNTGTAASKPKKTR